MPVLVGAAAGESLTVSVPPPAVYGYTPEQHVGTGRKTEIENLEKKKPLTQAEQEGPGQGEREREKKKR